MGSGIAQVMAVAGHDVVSPDISQDALAKARIDVATGRFGLQSAVERGKLSSEAADAALGRITFDSGMDAVAAVDVLIEAVPERLDLKVKVFRDFDRRAPGHTIFASNS